MQRVNYLLSWETAIWNKLTQTVGLEELAGGSKCRASSAGKAAWKGKKQHCFGLFVYEGIWKEEKTLDKRQGTVP